MTTVDLRRRFDTDADALDPGTFLDEHVAALPDGRTAEAGRAAGRLGLVPLTLDVEGEPLTFAVDGDRLAVRRGAGDALVVTLDRHAFSDLMQDVASTFGVHMSGRAKVERGSLDAFLEWEPVLRCLLDGRPVYEPGTITFHDRTGAPLDLHRSFTLDDDDAADIGHFLGEAGYLHLDGVFTEAEMAAVSAELDDAIAAAERDDGASWWARTAGGEWYPARILGFNQKSPTLRELLRSERFRSVGSFTDDRFVQRDPDVGDSAEGLLKKIGRGRRHVGRELAQGLLLGRAQPPLLWAHRRDLGDRGRTRERRARRGRRLAPRQRRVARRRRPRPAAACRSRPAPATSPCTARARST